MAIGIGMAFIGIGVGALVWLRRSSAVPTDANTPPVSAHHLVLDVRDFREFDAGHLEQAHNVPIDKLPQRFGLIEQWAGGKTRPVVVYCASGMRAERAQKMLKSAGFETVTNAGGYARLKNRR